MLLSLEDLSNSVRSTHSPDHHFPLLNDYVLPQRKVLVVDDNAYNLFVFDEILSLIDPSVIIATALNGQDALKQILADEHLNKTKEKPHCTFKFIFLDLSMPIMDGY